MSCGRLSELPGADVCGPELYFSQATCNLARLEGFKNASNVISARSWLASATGWMMLNTSSLPPAKLVNCVNKSSPKGCCRLVIVQALPCEPRSNKRG